MEDMMSDKVKRRQHGLMDESIDALVVAAQEDMRKRAMDEAIYRSVQAQFAPSSRAQEPTMPTADERAREALDTAHSACRCDCCNAFGYCEGKSRCAEITEPYGCAANHAAINEAVRLAWLDADAAWRTALNKSGQRPEGITVAIPSWLPKPPKEAARGEEEGA